MKKKIILGSVLVLGVGALAFYFVGLMSRPRPQVAAQGGGPEGSRTAQALDVAFQSLADSLGYNP